MVFTAEEAGLNAMLLAELMGMEANEALCCMKLLSISICCSMEVTSAANKKQTNVTAII